MTRLLLAIAILLSAPAAYAQRLCQGMQCQVPQRIVQKQVVVPAAQVVTTTVQPYSTVQYSQQYGLYTIAPYFYYSAGAAVQENAVAERIAKQVEKKLKGFLTTTQEQQQAPGVNIMSQRCAACHKEGARAVAEDHAPKMFDHANRWIGGKDDAIKAISAAKLGAMPPQPKEPLNDEEFLALKTYLESLGR